MAPNPVERRLVELLGHWHNFAESGKRLLIWRVRDNATRLLQCFFEVQKHETDYTAGDFFIVFDAPFEHSIQYSRVLKETLAGQYEASRDDLAQQGITPDWRFLPGDFTDTARGFIDSLASFAARHQEITGHVVAVLMPQSTTNEEAYSGWLQRCLTADIPGVVRIVAIDSAEHPRLSKLIESDHPLVYVDSPALDALTTAQETFAQEGGVGPAAVFRNYLMGLVTLVEKGSADQVIAKSADAFAFARKQQWADQEVVVKMLVSGALLKERRFDEAIKNYQGARQSATQATAADHPAGKQLILQTWFGEAGTHFAAGDAAKAAECYDEAAVIAQEIPNLILAIEAFRMSAYCHAHLGDTELAKHRGALALTLGEQLTLDTRAMTTLPVAAVDLLRIIEPERVKLIEDIKRRQIAQQGQALTDAEQSATALEATHDAQQLHAVEARLAADNGAAEQHAVMELETVAANGSEDFRAIFTRARHLLGAEWPLGMAVALPGAATGVAGT